MTHPLPSYRSHDPALYISNLLKVQRAAERLNACQKTYGLLREREKYGRHAIKVIKGYITSAGEDIDRARERAGEDPPPNIDSLIGIIRRYNHKRFELRQEQTRLAEVIKLVKREMREASAEYAEIKTHVNIIYKGEPTSLFAYINEEVKR